MDVRYSRFDPRARRLRDRMALMRRLFMDLLLRTNGDAERALDWLGQLGRRHGLFDADLSLEDVRRQLLGESLIAQDRNGMLRLAPGGERLLRTSSLDAIFAGLPAGQAGDHRSAAVGSGTERLPETRAWEFGDALNLLDSAGTLTEALRRTGPDELSVEERDLRVHDTEQLSSCATVLMVDVSHSMILYGEDRITPAKQVALALAELITTRYPKDALHVVLFGDEAWEVPLDELPYIGVGPFHTNTCAGLQLARQILRRKKQGNRQIFMLTDGKPSALTEDGGRIYKNSFGLDERVVNKTLDEAAACRRQGIPITTFMLTSDPTLVDFVERFTRTNKGRAYFSAPDRLQPFVLVDYVRNRRRRVR